MKVLSFDVGIKNLAFCLLNDKLIEDWGILNICIDEMCEHCHNGIRCNKSCSYYNNDIHVCSNHKNLINIDIDGGISIIRLKSRH